MSILVHVTLFLSLVVTYAANKFQAQPIHSNHTKSVSLFPLNG